MPRAETGTQQANDRPLTDGTSFGNDMAAVVASGGASDAGYPSKAPSKDDVQLQELKVRGNDIDEMDIKHAR